VFPQSDAKFKINAASHSKIVRAERLYYEKYLLGETEVPDGRKKETAKKSGNTALDEAAARERREKRKEALKKAVNLCMEAAMDLNPYAFTVMGDFYANGYMDESLPKKERLNAACACYFVVYGNDKLKNGIIDVENLEENERLKAVDSAQDLRIVAARKIYSVISGNGNLRFYDKVEGIENYLNSLSPEKKSVFDIESVLRRQIDLTDDDGSGEAEKEGAEDTEILGSTVFNMRNSENPPVFALMTVSKGVLTKFLDDNKFMDAVLKKDELRVYAKLNSAKVKFQRYKSEIKIREGLLQSEENISERVVLVITKNTAKIKDTLQKIEKGNVPDEFFSALCGVMEGQKMRSLVLYADDFKIINSNRIRDIVNYVQGGVD